MVPAGEITSKTITALSEVLEPGDTVIDGGNTHYVEDIRHAAELAEKGIHHVDVGTSGGVWGFERGFCLMIGGEERGRRPPLPHLRVGRARLRGCVAHAQPHRRSQARPSTASTAAAATAPATS